MRILGPVELFDFLWPTGDYEPFWEANELAIPTGLHEVRVIVGWTTRYAWAKDGRLRVWGKAGPSSPREPIPPQFWRTNRADGLHTVFEADEDSCTESASQLPMLEKFSALYVSRAQMEAVLGRCE